MYKEYIIYPTNHFDSFSRLYVSGYSLLPSCELRVPISVNLFDNIHSVLQM